MSSCRLFGLQSSVLVDSSIVLVFPALRESMQVVLLRTPSTWSFFTSIVKSYPRILLGPPSAPAESRKTCQLLRTRDIERVGLLRVSHLERALLGPNDHCESSSLFGMQVLRAFYDVDSFSPSPRRASMRLIPSIHRQENEDPSPHRQENEDPSPHAKVLLLDRSVALVLVKRAMYFKKTLLLS